MIETETLPANPTTELPPGVRSIVFFDGECGFCDWSVQKFLTWDKKGVLHFAPLQGPTAQKLLPVEYRENLDSIAFWEEGKITRHSSAIVRIWSSIGSPFGTLLWLVPKPLRDLGYWIFAKCRYRLFGRVDHCRMPKPGERARFLP